MPDSFSESNSNIVYITGFSVFGSYKANASEIIVKNLNSYISDNNTVIPFTIVTEILNVNYKEVFNKVPQKLQTLKPKLVIHVGVSNRTKIHLNLECVAFNKVYEMLDMEQCTPPNKECVKGGGEKLETRLNLRKVRDSVNADEKLDTKCTLSNDPGKYLCGFIYYLSLYHDAKRCVFIHVPSLEDVSHDAKKALQSLTATLMQVILQLYEQVKSGDEEKEVA